MQVWRSSRASEVHDLANRANKTNIHTRLISRHHQVATHPNPNPTYTMPPPRICSSLLRARPQVRHQCLLRTARLRCASTVPQGDVPKPVVPWKTPHSVWAPENLIPPPKDGEILMERKPNRELPPCVLIPSSSTAQHTNSPPASRP